MLNQIIYSYTIVYISTFLLSSIKKINKGTLWLCGLMPKARNTAVKLHVFLCNFVISHWLEFILMRRYNYKANLEMKFKFRWVYMQLKIQWVWKRQAYTWKELLAPTIRLLHILLPVPWIHWVTKGKNSKVQSCYCMLLNTGLLSKVGFPIW